MHCPRCGRDNVEPHPTDKHLCVDCVHAENNRLTYFRQNQDEWLTVANESGLDPWTQQPGETQWEYTIWVAYRDSYPGKRPVYSDVAKQLDTTYSVVQHIAQRWSFPVRMQLWMRFVDQTTLAQRTQEILDMNKEHIDLAHLANGKLKQAIEALEPATMKASEISSLLKTTSELERKARIDTVAQEEIQRELYIDPEQKRQKAVASRSDLAEVAQVLAAAGVLGGMKIKKTTTTEVTVDDAINVDAEVLNE